MNKGFLKIIVLLIVVIIILSLFKIRINAIFDNQFVKENFGFIWDMIKSFWNKYLQETPFAQMWTELVNKLPHPWAK